MHSNTYIHVEITSFLGYFGSVQEATTAIKKKERKEGIIGHLQGDCVLFYDAGKS